MQASRVRPVKWNMSKKYHQGWTQGRLEAEIEFKKKYHVSEISYKEIYSLIDSKGTISLRNNSYPIVSLPISFKTDDVYYLKAIYAKQPWSRFVFWASGTSILLVWQGLDAQILLQKIIRYIESYEKRSIALRALKWKRIVEKVVKGEEHTNTLAETSNVEVW